MKRLMCVLMVLLMGSLASAVVVQDSADTIAGFSYVAWQAEGYDGLTTGNTSKAAWTTAQQSSSSLGLYEDSPNYYGDGYLFASEKSYNTDGSNYVSYTITFTAAGDYGVFMRVSGFDGTGTVTNADSIYMPAASGGYMLSGTAPTSQVTGSGFVRDSGTSGLSAQWEWYRIDRRILVTEADLALTGEYAFELKVGSREGGFAFDSLVLTTPSDFSTLTGADLDSIFVPEPATLVLLALGAVAGLRRRG